MKESFGKIIFRDVFNFHFYEIDEESIFATAITVKNMSVE